MKKIFISYSHKDDEHREALGAHLNILEREQIVEIWHDRRIGVGQEWKNKIHENLESADIILLLVSPDFNNSDYCYDLEMKRALQRNDEGSAIVVPIIVRPCLWTIAPFAKLQAVPTDNQTIDTSLNKDSAWLEVVTKIKNVIDLLNSKPSPNAGDSQLSMAAGGYLGPTAIEKPSFSILQSYCQSCLKALREPIQGTPIYELRLKHYYWRRISWERRVKSDQHGTKYVRKLIQGQGEEPTIQMLGELLESRRVVLYDDAGMGKTAFTHKCFELLLDADHWNKRWNKRFTEFPPLVVRLEGRWPRREGQPLTIRDMLLDQIEKRLDANRSSTKEVTASQAALDQSLAKEVEAAIQDQRVVIFVDAFDQMTLADREHLSAMLALASVDQSPIDAAATACAWFITGRAYALKPFENESLKTTKRLRLEPFNEAEQNRYFSDMAKKDFFKQQGIAPLDWICRPRKNVERDLALPLNLREIRTLLETVVEGELSASEQKSLRFRSAGELHAHVARVLLQRGLTHVKERRKRESVRIPAGEPHGEDEQLRLLIRICGLIALQMMLEKRWNACVLADSSEHPKKLGQNAVQAFLQRAQTRFLHGCCSDAAQSGKPSISGDSNQHFIQANEQWLWAVDVLQEIEVSHRGHIDSFNTECRSFRDRKTMEWYAAHYLMNHATDSDLYMVIAGAGDQCVRNFAYEEEWLSNLWKQVIQMPGDHIHEDAAVRSLGVLLAERQPIDQDRPRPCEHIWRLWNRWLEPTSKSTLPLTAKQSQRLMDKFRSEYRCLHGNNHPIAKEIAEGFIAIPLGTFQMGSPKTEKGRYDDETRHEVTLTRKFSLHRFPVTNAEYELFDSSHGERRSEYSSGPDHPVVEVSWYEAWCFSRWVSIPAGECRLPTEAEWEYSCRAGSTGKYCCGNDESQLGDYAWYGKNSGGQTHPVGGKKANAWGLHDMHGNVREWCQDWYGEYAAEPPADPVGPSKGSGRVDRGGSWSISVAARCRSAYRSRIGPTFRGYNLGFRLALSPS
jgi:formylglycine-generating enzyme required for sulfatase activity